jgi:hypothetical protein
LPSAGLLLAALTLVLIFVPSTVSADTAQNDSPEINMIQITTG